MSEDEMSAVVMSVNKMPVDDMLVYKMTVDKMPETLFPYMRCLKMK
jgi:hypothetical protein